MNYLFWDRISLLNLIIEKGIAAHYYKKFMSFFTLVSAIIRLRENIILNIHCPPKGFRFRKFKP